VARLAEGPRPALEREIESAMEARLGRPCLFVPSGRLAIYLALRAWLKAGDRLLMSPLTDDVVFFTVLAAGLRPVMAPVSSADGNIQPDAVPNTVWAGLGGVLTTNLYGLPDRVHELRGRCDTAGIPLIEDAAHAIETSVAARPIGTFGDAAAFSLSKHVGASGGGVLAFTDESRRNELAELRDAAAMPGRRRNRMWRAAADAVATTVIQLHLVWPARWLRRSLRLNERTGYRMPLCPAELRRAIAAAPDLSPFNEWVRVDRHDYRVWPPARVLRHALRQLACLDDDRRRRVEGVARLRALPGVAEAVRDGDPQALFRVPVLVDDRDSMIAKLERRVLGVGYIYDPPLDDYAGSELADPSPSPEAARWWAPRVLPLDPLEADAILRALA
jgi:hypothetical protein